MLKVASTVGGNIFLAKLCHAWSISSGDRSGKCNSLFLHVDGLIILKTTRTQPLSTEIRFHVFHARIVKLMRSSGYQENVKKWFPRTINSARITKARQFSSARTFKSTNATSQRNNVRDLRKVSRPRKIVCVKISWRGSNVTRSKIRISFTVPRDRQCRRAISRRRRAVLWNQSTDS